jgi:uroporphyrinogen decarboxylase
MNSGMTSRQRVLAALAHQETDRVPFSLFFGINEPARKELAAYLNMKSLGELDIHLQSYTDLKSVGPDFRGPSDRNVGLADGSYVDAWGVVRTPVSYGAGHYDEISYYPLAGVADVKELDSFRWPSAAWYDCSTLKEKMKQINQGQEHAFIAANGNIFESSWYMRGFERMLMDLIVEPELAWEIMSRVTDFLIAYFKRILEAADGMIDVVFTADDLGHQDGLIVSLALWEKMIKPHHMRLNKALHEFGVKIMYHTDGAIMKIVPGLIDMGIDILEPLQFDARDMDPTVLKTLYGDRLCFHGGVSVQKTLPFGTPEQVREEVGERIKVLGKNGGYILSSSHAIQAGTPPENIVALLEASRA